MAIIEKITDLDGNTVFNVQPEENESTISLATANTYVDKNIIFNIASSLDIDVATVEETLAYLGITILDLTEEEF